MSEAPIHHPRAHSEDNGHQRRQHDSRCGSTANWGPRYTRSNAAQDQDAKAQWLRALLGLGTDEKRRLRDDDYESDAYSYDLYRRPHSHPRRASGRGSMGEYGYAEERQRERKLEATMDALKEQTRALRRQEQELKAREAALRRREEKTATAAQALGARAQAVARDMSATERRAAALKKREAIINKRATEVERRHVEVCAMQRDMRLKAEAAERERKDDMARVAAAQTIQRRFRTWKATRGDVLFTRALRILKRLETSFSDLLASPPTGTASMLETLTKQLEAADSIVSNGNAEIRKLRKDYVRRVMHVIDHLDSESALSPSESEKSDSESEDWGSGAAAETQSEALPEGSDIADASGAAATTTSCDSESESVSRDAFDHVDDDESAPDVTHDVTDGADSGASDPLADNSEATNAVTGGDDTSCIEESTSTSEMVVQSSDSEAEAEAEAPLASDVVVVTDAVVEESESKSGFVSEVANASSNHDSDANSDAKSVDEFVVVENDN